MEVSTYREPYSASKRKYSSPATSRREAFGVEKMEFLAVGKMSSVQERKTLLLHGRCKAELDAVRGLLAKATAALSASSPATATSAPPRGKIEDRRFLAVDVEKPRSEEPPAKRRKASPPPVAPARAEAVKVTWSEREQLVADLADLPAELPAHVVELLLKQSHGCRGGSEVVEIDTYSMENAAVVELKHQVDIFVPERNLRRRAMDSSGSGVAIHNRSPPQPRQDVKTVEDDLQLRQDVKTVEDEEEDVDICGGVSPTLAVAIPYLDAGGSPSSSSSDSGSSTASGSDSGRSDSDDDDSSSSNESIGSPAAGEQPVSSSDTAKNVADPEKPPEQRAATPPMAMAELIVRGRESTEKARKEERALAREKARQELLEMEKTATRSDYIHPADLESLGIIDQYMVSRPPPPATKKKTWKFRL